MAEPNIRKKRTAKQAPTYASKPDLRKRGNPNDTNQQTRQYSANSRVTPTPKVENIGGATFPSSTQLRQESGGVNALRTGPQAFAASSGGTHPTSTQLDQESGGVAAANAGTPESEELFGFSGRHFTNADLPTVWENPWLIVNAALKDRGNDTIPLKELMRQYGELGLPIFTMLHGLTGDIGDLGSAETINWISRWVNSMSQKGGNVPSYEGLLGNLLQGRGTDTVLGEALNSGQATDQVNTMMTYLRAALGTNSLNPIASSAVLSQANREGDNFLEASMGGQDGYTRNFTDWLNSGGHRLFGDPRYS